MRHDADEHRAEPDHLAHDRSAAVADGPSVRERPAEFLLERQEEPGCEGEHGEPHRGDRCELLGAADGHGADLEEGVGGDAGDQQRDADGDGPLGQRSAALTGISADDTSTRS